MISRKPAALVILALVLAASANAQVVSPPPICFSFNDLAPLPFGLPTVGIGNVNPGDLGATFTCPVTSRIDRLDLWSVEPTCSPQRTGMSRVTVAQGWTREGRHL
jgi:hypothetical protein